MFNFNVSIMRPKSRTHLRVIISQLYDYLKNHDDLLDFESEAVNEALRLLVIADMHLAHLSISHKTATSLDS